MACATYVTLLVAAAVWWTFTNTILCLDPVVPCFSSTTPPDTDNGGFTVITGCSSGIGRELALLYAKRGARLILAARRKALLEQLSVECLHLGAKEAVVVAVDISANAPAIIEALPQGGVISELVLNHAYIPLQLIHEAGEDLSTFEVESSV